MAVIGAIAASYAIASVVSDLIMSPFSESVNNLSGEFHTALSYLNTTGVAKLTTEEQSFVGSWWLIGNTTNETRILSNWSFFYDRTYSQINYGDNYDPDDPDDGRSGRVDNRCVAPRMESGYVDSDPKV